MATLTRASSLGLVLVLVACGSPAPAPDDVVTSDTGGSDAPPGDVSMGMDVGTDASSPGPDGGNPVDASSGSDAAACAAPDAGALQTNYYCDLAQIHVLRGATATVQIVARVGGMASCGAVDGVDVLRGATMLAHLGATASVSLGDEHGLIAAGDAPAALVAECANETTRLSAYGLVVRGRDAHGPFEARCGSAESGSRWPPGTSLLCHTGIAQPPAEATQFTVMHGAAMGLGYLLHAAGTVAATSIDSTVRIVSPQQAAFSGGSAMLSSHDTTGWTNATSETMFGPTPATQITMVQNTPPVALDANYCPPPTTPGPGMTLPPYYVMRFTGQGPAGAIEFETLSSCMSTPF